MMMCHSKPQTAASFTRTVETFIVQPGKFWRNLFPSKLEWKLKGKAMRSTRGALDDAPATDREPAGVAVAMNDALGILRRLSLYTLSACGDPYALAGDTVPQNASMLVTDLWLCRGREVT